MNNSDKDLQDIVKELKNKKAREWRKKNKDKVKAINQRYWLNQAKKFKKEKENECQK